MASFVLPHRSGPRLRCLRGLRTDTAGAALVEFAILALPFFGLIIAVFQITTTFLAQQALETAGEKAVRQILVGTAQKNGTTQAQFKSSICAKLPSFLKCANLYVDVRTAGSFSAADTSATNITFGSNGNLTSPLLYKPGAAGEVTVVRIVYVWSVQGGPLNFNMSNMGGNKRLLSATSVFKTEPYA